MSLPVRPVQPIGRATLVALATFTLVKLLLPLVSAPPFGYFRDELYFIVCGLRPDWGYVDHPPLAPLLAAAGWKLFGETLYGVRFFPALSGAVTVALTVLLARRLGAGPFGQALAGLALLLAPFYLVVGAKLSTDSFEVLFWTLLAWATLRLVQEGDPRLWMLFGAAAGLGLEAKHSVVFFAFALVAGLFAVRRWDLLTSRWVLAGAGLGLLLFLPNLVWQWQHGWPTLELLNNIRVGNKNVVLGPLAYLGEQVFLLGPLNLPLWLAGLLWLLRARDDRNLRVFGVAWLVTFALIVSLKGKAYYLGPAYPILFAAGAVAFERFTATGLRRGLRALWVGLSLAFTALILPIGFPLLSPERTAAHLAWIGIAPKATEHSHDGVLPQNLADRLGWEEMVAGLARAHGSLPAAERAKAGIVVQNFGQAGAVDILGRPHGLPPALSGHQNYFLWGPRGFTGEVLLVLDDAHGLLPELCASVQDLGPAGSHPHALPGEQRNRIYVCRGLRQPLAELWPRIKVWM